MNKIRKGDEVIVLTGRDKGKRGTAARRFLVKGGGWASSDNSWEPLAHVVSSAPFREYARMHDDVSDVDSDSSEAEGSESDSESDSDSDN